MLEQSAETGFHVIAASHHIAGNGVHLPYILVFDSVTDSEEKVSVDQMQSVCHTFIVNIRSAESDDLIENALTVTH